MWKSTRERDYIKFLLHENREKTGTWYSRDYSSFPTSEILKLRTAKQLRC